MTPSARGRVGETVLRLNAKVSAALPPLAWLLEIDGAPDRHRLICGTSVCRSETAFFEGAWPGSVAAMDFAEKADAFGSGGVLGAGYEVWRSGAWSVSPVIDYSWGDFDGVPSPPGVTQDLRYRAWTLRAAVTWR